MRISDWSSDVCSSDLGYNVQAAVDADQHLVVAHEVVTTGSERAQLAGMAQQARAAIGGDEITVVADRGYFSGRQILACEDAQIAAYVPKPLTSSARAAGRFDRRDFIYDADRDCYRCPAGEDLVHRCTRSEEHTSELQSLMRISYAVFSLKKKAKRQSQH